jgi:hypothetical protein
LIADAEKRKTMVSCDDTQEEEEEEEEKKAEVTKKKEGEEEGRRSNRMAQARFRSFFSARVLVETSIVVVIFRCQVNIRCRSIRIETIREEEKVKDTREINTKRET